MNNRAPKDFVILPVTGKDIRQTPCLKNFASSSGPKEPILIELCWGVFNVPRAWHSLNTGPQI